MKFWTGILGNTYHLLRTNSHKHTSGTDDFVGINVIMENIGLSNYAVYELSTLEEGYLTKFEYFTLVRTVKRNFRRILEGYNSSTQTSFAFLSVNNLYSYRGFKRLYTMKKKNSRMGKGKGKDALPIVSVSAENDTVLLAIYAPGGRISNHSLISSFLSKISHKIRFSTKITISKNYVET